MDSYIAGLYHKYTRGSWYVMSSIFGGYLDADIKTDDGIQESTDGYQAGVRISTGYNFAFAPGWTITPNAALGYTRLFIDDLHDSVGKSADFDNASMLEAEAGAALEKNVYTNNGYAKVFVRPSIIRTFNSGNKTVVTGLPGIEMPENQTLYRLQAGGRYSFADSWMLYTVMGYTFGSGYRDTSVDVGLNYSF